MQAHKMSQIVEEEPSMMSPEELAHEVQQYTEYEESVTETEHAM